MYHYNNLMVALDLSYMDEILIEYTSFICNLVDPEKIYFINIQKNLEVPDEVLQEFKDLDQPHDDLLKKQLKEKVEKHFKNNKKFDIEYKIAEGGEVKQILHWAKVKLIDLLIVGKKDLVNGSGHTAQMFTRKLMCSVLMVPEKPNYDLKEILIPTDFSDYSDMAVDKAIEIANHQDETRLYFLHIYELPIGYYTTGKTEAEFADIIKNNAIKQFDGYIAKKELDGINYTPLFALDMEHNPSSIISEKAREVEADLIILGAKGRTPATSIFLGSVTEKIIRIDLEFPILIVKSKKRSFDVLEFIKYI